MCSNGCRCLSKSVLCLAAPLTIEVTGDRALPPPADMAERMLEHAALLRRDLFRGALATVPAHVPLVACIGRAPWSPRCPVETTGTVVRLYTHAPAWQPPGVLEMVH